MLPTDKFMEKITYVNKIRFDKLPESLIFLKSVEYIGRIQDSILNVKMIRAIVIVVLPRSNPTKIRLSNKNFR